MGINLQNTFFKNLLLMLILSVSLVGCLPAEKETQCASSEAFDASKRKCVPVIGASTSNTVFIGSKSPANSYTTPHSTLAPIAHTVSVSDVYNYGFTVKWFVHTSTVTATSPSLSNSVAFNFFPNVYPAGTYVVEAVLYDQAGVNQLDSVSWNIIVSSLTPPQLTSAIPAATAYTYLNTISTPQTLQATISSPDSEDGNYFIYLDGVLVETGPFSGVSTVADFAVTPNTLSNGLHTLEIKLHDGGVADPLFDSYTWVLNIIDPDYPVIQPIGASGNPILTETITVRDGITFDAGGWSQTNTGVNLDLGTTGLCVEFDDVDKLVPTGTADIDVKYVVNGNLISTGTRVGLTNVFCADHLQLNAAQVHFNLTNPDIAEARTITVQTFATGTNDLIEALSWNVVVRPKNIRPVISIDGPALSAGMSCSRVTDVSYNNCDITQSVNNNVDSNDTDYIDAGDSGSTASEFAIRIDYDPDIQAETDYQVFYQLKKTGAGAWNNVDVIGGASSNPSTYSDCTYDHTETSGTVPSGQKLVCALRMDAFNNLGKLESGTYELQAFVRDANNGVGSGVTKDSNIVTWAINVTENQDLSSTSIAPFITAGIAASQDYYVNGSVDIGNPTYTQSWIAANTSSTAALGTISEGTQYVINTLVRDTQRDDFSLSVTMSNQALGGISPLSSTTVYQRTDHKEWFRAQTTVTIPEWAVTADGASNIYVSVSDRPESYIPACVTCSTDQATLTINVNNVNPPPVFGDASIVDLTGYFAVAGVPFNIDVLSSHITDASLYDGAGIEWQWRIDVGQTGTFVDIPNANNSAQATPALVWTPNHNIPSGTLIDLRLCAGDDGSGNEVATCAVNKNWTGLSVIGTSNYVARTEVPGDASNGDDVASWYDPATKSLYTTYTTLNKIFVEKSIIDPTNNNEFKPVHSISFPTEDSFAGEIPVIARELSISGNSDDGLGTNGQLVIAYKVNENVNGLPQYRIRRIDIRDGRLNFNYCGFYFTNNDAPHSTCQADDLYDEGASTLEASPNVTFSSASTGVLDITFTAAPLGNEVLILKTNNGSSVNYQFNVATNAALNIQGYCSGGSCGVSPSSTATDLAAAINNTQLVPTVGADIEAASHEFYAEVVAANTVRIHGPAEFDYYDEVSSSASYIGNVQVIDDHWILPFLDVSQSQKISMGKGDSVRDPLGLVATPIVSTTFVTASDTNNREVKQFYKGASLYLAAKNEDTDLDVFKLDAVTLAVTDSVKNVYTNAAIPVQLEDVDITVNDAMTDVFVSAVNISGAGTNRNLTMTRLNAANLNINTPIEKISAIGFENYVEDIRHARIVSDRTVAGDNYIVLSKTSTAITNPDSAYMIKVNFSGGAFDFHEYDYPKLNVNSLVSDSAINVTPIYTFTGADSLSHSSGPAVSTVAAPAQDTTSNPLFFSFHESDTVDKIRNGFYNTNETNVMTDSTTVNGSYPAFIGN